MRLLTNSNFLRKAFPDAWRARLGLSVETVTGSAENVLAMALDIVEGDARAPRGCRRVIVKSVAGDSFLSDEDRELLWRAFEAPVFEHVVSDRGELLAWECDAHDGLHLNSATGDLARAGFRGSLPPEPCACGAAGMRLMPARPCGSSRKNVAAPAWPGSRTAELITG